STRHCSGANGISPWRWSRAPQPYCSPSAIHLPAPSPSGSAPPRSLPGGALCARRTAASTAKTSVQLEHALVELGIDFGSSTLSGSCPVSRPETPSAGETVGLALTQQSFELDRRC